MEIVLKRIAKKRNYTIGRLYLLADDSVKRISLPGKKIGDKSTLATIWYSRWLIITVSPLMATSDNSCKSGRSAAFAGKACSSWLARCFLPLSGLLLFLLFFFKDITFL